MFVRVSVVARPRMVSELVGSVSVPVFEIDEMIGAVRVLFVRVCDPVRETSVSVPFGTVMVPEVLRVKVPAPLIRFVAVLPLKVLFVSVSVVARPSKVSVLVGSVSVPVFEI